ncbi:hypothetical protein NVP1173O_05 [Vibrio phage 1.173.O._10N.261.55.A11]|nr:hypothetical protein NVP1173O_05 [Vibrio phage 1.173.O._10N.261.55.A11]
MNLHEAITIARKCLHGADHYLEREGITYEVKCEAYSVIAEYHAKIALLYDNDGATECVLQSLSKIGN